MSPSVSQKRDRLVFAMLDLVHRALARVFVRTPAQNSCAVPKSAAGKMVVSNFDDHFGRDRLPFAGAIGARAARSSGRVTGKPGWFPQTLKFLC